MSVCRLTVVQLFYFFIFFYRSSIPLVLFYNTGISHCFNMLFLLSPRLCFIIDFICGDLFVARSDSWRS